MVAYAFAPDNSRIRTVSLVPWGAGSSGLFLPRWPQGVAGASPIVWTWSGAAFSSAALTSGALNLPINYGFAGAASDGAGNAWTTQYSGSLVSYTSAAVASGFPLPGGHLFNGVAYVPGFSTPYVATASGRIFAGTGAAAVGVGFGRPTWFLATSGTTLFALASGSTPTSGGFATFSLTSSGAGTSGFVLTPFSYLNIPMCIAASTAASSVAVGGWSNYTLATGYTYFAFASGAANMIALASGAGLIDLFSGISDAWTRTQSVTGAGHPAFAIWTPDNTHILISDPTSGTVRNFTFLAGTITSGQVLNIPNATQIAITPDGRRALVTQNTSNTVTPLTLSGAVWVSGTPVSGIASPRAILALTSARAVVGFASGLSYLSLVGNSWVTSGSASLAFNPSTVLTASGYVMAAGTQGSSGFFSVVSGTAGVFTDSWVGSGSSMIFEQGQVVITNPASGAFRTYGNLFTNFMLVYNFVTPNEVLNGVAVSPLTPQSSGGTVFASNLAGTAVSLYQFTTPFYGEPIRNGAVGIYKGGSWVQAVLGSGQVPTAVTFDTSGNVYAATLMNNLYTVTSGGVISASGAILQFTGQPQSTPLGISAMTFVGSGLYGSSSLAGPLVKLN